MKYKKNKILIIIPYAGGNCYSMKELKESINFIDVQVVELPGRGRRVGEKLLTNIDDIVEDLYDNTFPLIDNYQEFYLFGHSMGALLAFLLTHLIILRTNKSPSCVFVSGKGGPSFIRDRENSFSLPSSEFRKKLKELGGCPDEVLSNEDLMDFFEPILRADFEVIERYNHKKMKRLNSKIVAFYGSEEDVNRDEVLSWQKESILPIEVIELTGNHFFIFNNKFEISKIIKKYIFEANLKES